MRSRVRFRRRRCRQRVNINDEAYYQYKRIETVEFAQERRKLGRQYGEANIDICHRPSDLASQTDDGTATAKLAQGLLADSATKIVFRQSAGELDLCQQLLELRDRERNVIAGLGRGHALRRVGSDRLVARHAQPDQLRDLLSTDSAM